MKNGKLREPTEFLLCLSKIRKFGIFSDNRKIQWTHGNIELLVKNERFSSVYPTS